MRDFPRSFGWRAAVLAAASVVATAAVGCGSDDGGSTVADTTTASDTTTAGDTATAGDTTVGDAIAGDIQTDTGTVAPAPQIITTDYRTADQMLLANEINESGEPFAEALGYNLDELDPAVAGVPDDIAYSLGIENYEYSRYQLGTVISRSGIGLHMMWAPVIGRMAAMEPAGFDGSMTGTPNGYNEDDELMKNIMMFSTLANKAPPGNPWPQFAEFVGGDPHLPQAVDAAKFNWEDFSTLRWDRSKMDKILNPAALGQTLMKQYLWAQDMLGAFHNAADEGIEPDGVVSPDLADSPDFDPDNDVYFGGDSTDGFVGMVLTAESINKVAFMTGALAYDGTSLGAIDLATYDPADGIKFFPHGVAVTEAPVAAGLPPKASSLVVQDDASDLFDQTSMLWALAAYVNMMDPTDTSDPAHIAYRDVFDGSPFPASMSETGSPGPYDLMKGTAKAIFMNLQAMHYDATDKVYVATAHLGTSGVERSSQVEVQGSTYLIVALETFIEEFAGTPLAQAATNAVKDQANFLISGLSDGAGSYYDAVTLGDAAAAKTRSLASQAAAVRGLYVAHRITGDAAYLTAADAAYERLIADYHVADQDIFRTTIGDDMAEYTPRNFALLSGALREASLEGAHEETPAIYTAVWRKVTGLMQLSEDGHTGESGGDSDDDGVPFIPEQADQLPPVFATKGMFPIAN